MSIRRKKNYLLLQERCLKTNGNYAFFDAGGATLADNVKRIYEGMFLVDSTFAASSWDEVIALLQRIFDRAKAEVINIRKWDERRLCYEIKRCRRGTYILAYFKADTSTLTAIERDVNLSEQILRSIMIRADYLSKNEDEALAQMNAATPAESSRGDYDDGFEGEDREENEAIAEEEAVVDAIEEDVKD